MRRAMPALAVALLAGCYDPPKPACGFRCGAGGACPEDYTCGADNTCHLAGAPTSSCGVIPDARPDGGDEAPMVVEVFPAPGTTDAAVDVDIFVRFSEAVVDVNDASIALFTTAGGTPWPCLTAYDALSMTAFVTPLEQLPGNTAMTLLLSSQIVDADGLPLDGPTMFMFTTGADTVAPRVRRTMPGSGDVVPPRTAIVIDFDEPVLGVDTTTFTVDAGGPISGAVTTVNGGKQARFEPTAALPPAATVTASLSTAITDAAGNALPAPVTITFATQ